MPIDMTLRDDVLRRELFEMLVERLDAAREFDEALVVANRTPSVFSLSKGRNQLTVSQGQGQRLLRGRLEWSHARDAADHDEPWTFTVSRAVGNPPRLALTPDGYEGTADEIVTLIVETFVEKTAPD